MTRRATIAFVTAAALLEGCGGGGSSTGTSLPAAPLAPQMASIQLVLKVPALSAQVRSHKYVSPSTQSVGVTVDGGTAAFTNVTAGSAACTGSTAPYNCTITVTAAAGSHTLAFTTYDQTNGGGNQLSANSTNVTFVAGQSPSIPLVLNGIPASIVASGTGFAANPNGGYYMLEGTNQKVSIVALDADKNMIVGSGAPTIAVAPANGSSLTVATPAPNQGNTFTLNDGAFESSSPTFTATEPGASSPAVTQTANVTATTLTSTFAGTQGSAGNVDGAPSSVKFHLPMGITLAANGNAIVVDRNNCSLRSLAPTGANAGTTSTLTSANPCYGPAPGPTSTPVPTGLYHPTGIALDTTNGNYYVTDFGHCTVDQVTSTGAVTVIAGTGTCTDADNAIGTSAAFNYPIAITYDASTDALFVADNIGCSIRKIVPTAPYAVSSVVVPASGATGHCTGRNYSYGGQQRVSQHYSTSGNGSFFPVYAYNTGSATTGIDQPGGLVPDGQGNLYVTNTNRCVIQKVSESSGAITLVSGVYNSCSEADGSATTAHFYYPEAVAIGNGYLYVADSIGNAIRAVSLATGAVTTISGKGVHACGSWWIPAARSAKSNGSQHRRPSSLHAMICTAIPFSNGWGTDATYNTPSGIVLDAANNRLLVTEQNNELVRQILL